VSLSFMQRMPYPRRTALISRKITLQPDEALDIEPNWHSVRVLSGRAWINSNGTNISLSHNQQTLALSAADNAMIFAASHAIIQIFYHPST